MTLQVLGIVQLILAVLLIIAVLLQQKGAGLGAGFGGGGNVQTTRRGPEKFLHQSTIVISFLFFVTSLALIILA